MKLALMVGAPDMGPEDGYVSTPTGSYEETVARAARLGFDGVEILAALRTDGDLYELRQALQSSGVGVAGFNSGRLLFDHGLVLLCGTSRECAMTRSAMYDLIRYAAPFSAHINIGMFRGLPSTPDHAPAVDRLVDTLQLLADYARNLGVELLVEPQNKEEFPFISSTTEGLALVERIDRPNVGLMLDTFHMMVENENMADSIQRAGPYLRHIHLLDRDRNPPAADSADVDMPTILGALRSVGYEHYLSVPLVKDEPDTATTETVRGLRALMAAN